MKVRIGSIACVAVVLLASAAWAHQFWIQPSKYRVARGETVDLPLRFGDDFTGDPAPRDNLRLEKFVVLGPGGVEPVPGDDGRDPAGRVVFGKVGIGKVGIGKDGIGKDGIGKDGTAKDGIYVVAFRNGRRSIEVAAPRFEKYLKEDGLDRIAKIRADRGETEKVGREIYSRCAKAVLCVGEGAADGHDRVAALRLEIVPETNPYRVAAGAEMAFRVLFEEKPLEGVLLAARNRLDGKSRITARTDAQGRSKLRLERAGEWLVSCVHMIEAPKDTGMDWESLWASLTFELAAAAKPGTPK